MEDSEHMISSTVETEEFKPSSVGLLLTGLYPQWTPPEKRDNALATDSIRGDLALDTYRRAKELGFTVIASLDDRNPPEFINRIREMGIEIHTLKNNGMSAGRSEALRVLSARDVSSICYLEPEKTDLLEYIEPLTRPIRNGEADIVIPKRSPKSLKTYPNYQIESESRGNRLWNWAMRRAKLLSGDTPDLDVMFGPRIMRNDPRILAPFYEAHTYTSINNSKDQLVDPGLWPDFLFLPLAQALCDGTRVASVEIDYHHPKAQTNFESNINQVEYAEKRARQFQIIMRASLEHIKHLQGKPSRLEKISS